MQVLKFGGSSVAAASAISRVTGIVSKALEQDRTIVVCSAISRCTDTLIEIGPLPGTNPVWTCCRNSRTATIPSSGNCSRPYSRRR